MKGGERWTCRRVDIFAAWDFCRLTLKMIQNTLFLFANLLCVAAGASAKKANYYGQDNSVAAEVPAYSCISAWPAGTVFGAQYSVPSNATLANSTNALFSKLLAQNATLAQIGIPWASIETTPGAPNFEILAELLFSATQENLTPLVNIAAINTNIVSVPTDLADPDDPHDFARA